MCVDMQSRIDVDSGPTLTMATIDRKIAIAVASLPTRNDKLEKKPNCG
jgi:hypothetical protein